MRPGLRNTLFATVLIAVIVIAIELLLRVIAPVKRSHDPRFISNLEWDYPEFIIKDHDLFWRFRPNQSIESNFFVEGTYTINSHGLRSPEFDVPKPAGTTRIVCLGNSCTFGYGVPDDATYPRRLETTLRAAQPGANWEVVDAGVTGYGSLQGLRLARRHLAEWQPDIVTICYGWNDHWFAAGNVMDKDQDLPAQWLLSVQNTLSLSQTYRRLKGLLFGVIGKGGGSPDEASVVRVTPEDYERNIAELIVLCQRQGAHVILITAPIAEFSASLNEYFAPLVRFHARYNNTTRALAQSRSLGLIDAAARFVGRYDLYDNPKDDPIHYNARGHGIIADMLQRSLLGIPNDTDAADPVTPQP